MSDVRAFGAVGDGKHDDTQAIRHAIAEGDGRLEFEPGTYRITQTLEVDLAQHGPLSITGSGATATITMEGPGPAWRLRGTHRRPAHPEGIDDSIWTTERMPTMSGLALTGTHEESGGIELIGTFQATLKGLHIRQCRDAIRLLEHNRNVILAGCHLFHNRGTGVLIENCNLHQINVVGNHISYNRWGGIRIHGSQVYNLQITGNDIEYNNANTHGTAPTPAAEIDIDATGPDTIVNEVTIASNTIQATVSPGGCNLRIRSDRQPDQPRTPGLYAITGNVIGSQETNLHLQGCHGVTVSSNTIYSALRHNALIEDSEQVVFSGNHLRRHRDDLGCGLRLQRCQRSVVQGCVIEDENPDGQPSGISTMEVADCQHVSIANCQLLAGVPHCLHVENGTAINVTGCGFSEHRQEAKTVALVRFSGKGSSNRIGGSILGPGGQQPIQADSEAGLVVAEDNVFAPQSAAESGAN